MNEFSILIELLTLIAILGGLVFGVLEIRRGNQARRDEAAINILSSRIYAENMGVVIKILDLPENAKGKLISTSKDFSHQAMQISSQMESWGILVFQRKIDLHDLDFMVGGLVRQLWNRLQNFIYDRREKFDNPNDGEWFQWLVERLDEDPAPNKDRGAYHAFRNWKR